jgi:hypothetical protein
MGFATPLHAVLQNAVGAMYAKIDVISFAPLLHAVLQNAVGAMNVKTTAACVEIEIVSVECE